MAVLAPTMGVVAMRHGSRLLTLLAAVALAAGQLVLSAAPAGAAVRSCSTSTPVAQRPTLRLHDSGSCVVVAQKALVSKGYSLGSAGADGDFGTATLRAARAFQTEFGLDADGVIGPLTWSRLGTGSAYNRGRGPNTTSRVVATFDDCPPSVTAFRAMVEAADTAGVGLVLAPTGACLTKFRDQGVDLAVLARSHGQYVINPSVSHVDLTTISYASVLKQLAAPGVVTNFGRPPYGASSTTVATAYTAAGMRQWTWTVDTRDWTGKTAAQVVAYVVANSRAGDTVLMHMGWKAFTPTALAQIRAGLAGRGLSLCAAYDGTTPTRLPRSLPCAG